MTRRVHCAHSIRVDLPLARAMELFTPAGERRWAEGWDPAFPAADGEDVEVGRVFVTRSSHGETYWTVAEEEPSRLRYARVTPGESAGLVEVRCRPEGNSATLAEVVYDLTALTDEAGVELEAFKADYTDYIDHWQAAIAEALAKGQEDAAPG